MKKLMIAFAIVLFGVSSVKAQDYSGLVKVNPIGFVFGIFNATYEKPLSETGSVTVGANFYNWKNLGISGLGADLGYRFYFSNNTTAPEGLFAGPVLSVSSLSYDYTSYNFDTGATTSDKESTISIGGGVKAGYQWVWDSGVALDLYFGYGYRSASFKNYNYTGGYPILGLAIGYAFE